MKSLITSIASMVLILLLISQLVSTQITYMRFTKVEQIISNFKEIVRQDGFVKPDVKENFINELSIASGAPKEKVTIKSSPEKKLRGEKITYEISIEMDGPISSIKFLGIKDRKLLYNSKRMVVSEAVI